LRNIVALALILEYF